MAFKKPIIRLTTINLSKKTAEDPELRERLFSAKTQFDCLAVEAKKARLTAENAGAKYQMLAAQRHMSMNDFFLLAGEVDTTIATEEGCMPPYFNKDGDLCVDIPFTQREQRLAVAASHKQLLKAAENEDGDIDPDLYASGDEN